MRTQWMAFAAVIAVSFAVLGWTGTRIYQEAPPVPFDGTPVRSRDGQLNGIRSWSTAGILARALTLP